MFGIEINFLIFKQIEINQIDEKINDQHNV